MKNALAYIVELKGIIQRPSPNVMIVTRVSVVTMALIEPRLLSDHMSPIAIQNAINGMNKNGIVNAPAYSAIGITLS